GIKSGGTGFSLDETGVAGSLIDALEALRSHLCRDFLPPRDEHPAKTYRRELQRAKEESRFYRWWRRDERWGLVSLLPPLILDDSPDFGSNQSTLHSDRRHTTET